MKFILICLLAFPLTAFSETKHSFSGGFNIGRDQAGDVSSYSLTYSNDRKFLVNDNFPLNSTGSIKFSLEASRKLSEGVDEEKITDKAKVFWGSIERKFDNDRAVFKFAPAVGFERTEVRDLTDDTENDDEDFVFSYRLSIEQTDKDSLFTFGFAYDISLAKVFDERQSYSIGPFIKINFSSK